MLHWLAGQKQSDGPTDPDTTGYVEPPETPAPVFAVHAFKHAIFGTPQTTQPKPRRNSSTENARPRNGEARPVRPGMSRPKSANDAQALAREDGQHLIEAPLSSPTKGILLTPGTAAAKKKNVTFGEQVVHNEEKRPLKSGLPDDCPGKFPSPGTTLNIDLDSCDEHGEKGASRKKLSEALEEARDDSRKRKSKSEKRSKKDAEGDSGVPAEFVDPKSDSGKYWKHQYDIYRTNTQREVRKLITKQKAAKSFALSKDIQCTEIADQLRLEQKKIHTIEAKTMEFASQMKDLAEKLLASQEAERKCQEEIEMLKRQNGRRDSARPTSRDAVTSGPIERRDSENRSSREPVKAENDPVQRPSEPYKPTTEREKPKLDLQTLRDRVKAVRSENAQLKPNDDIWAQSYNSSSPSMVRLAEQPPSSTNGGRAVTSGTDATPLKTLDGNTLSNPPESRRQSSLRSMQVECNSPPDMDMVDRKDLPKAEAQPQPHPKSPVRSQGLPVPPYEPEPTIHHVAQTAKRKPSDEQLPSKSTQIQESSPFQPHAKTFPARPAGPRQEPDTKLSQPNSTKENISPSSKPDNPLKEFSAKPSAMWNAINTTQANKRSTSVTGKDGKEVSYDRIEAARARINARGRVTS